MPSLNNLVSPQQSAEPPDVQGASGTGQGPSLQGLTQQGGGGGGGQMQPPDHHETAALLQHIYAFRARWAEILRDPEIGEKNVRPQVYDMMADMMSDEYVSLPQVMDFLKTMPTEPLEQKQWIEKHIQEDDKQATAVLDHHAANPNPLGPGEQFGGPQNSQDRSQLVTSAISRYKQFSKKNKPMKKAGIPINA